MSQTHICHLNSTDQCSRLWFLSFGPDQRLGHLHQRSRCVAFLTARQICLELTLGPFEPTPDHFAFSDCQPVSLPQSSVCGLSGQHRTTLLFGFSTGQFALELSLWFRSAPDNFAFPTISRSLYLRAQFVAFLVNTGPLCFSDYQPVSLPQSSVCGL